MTANIPKTSGHALLVGGEACCEQPRRVLSAIGYHTEQTADPYAAMLELCRRPLVYRAIVLSLQSLYRDEISVITTVRRRFPHVSVWLSHTDGRAAALADAMRLGAEALIGENDIHPLAEAVAQPAPSRPLAFYAVPPSAQEDGEPEVAVPTPAAARRDKMQTSGAGGDHTNGRGSPSRPSGEPVLSAAELRALLGDAAG